MRSLADPFTIYRIAAAPVIAAMALVGQRDAFFVLLIISLATDLVDGPLARWLGTASERGARLDTIADAATTLAALLGIVLFERDTLQPELPWIIGFFVSYISAAAACLLRFGRLPAYHLYLSKLGAILASVFVVWLYAIDYSRIFLIAVLGVGMLANLESVIVTFRLRQFRSDLGSALFANHRHVDEDRDG